MGVSSGGSFFTSFTSFFFADALRSSDAGRFFSASPAAALAAGVFFRDLDAGGAGGVGGSSLTAGAGAGGGGGGGGGGGAAGAGLAEARSRSLAALAARPEAGVGGAAGDAAGSGAGLPLEAVRSRSRIRLRPEEERTLVPRVWETRVQPSFRWNSSKCSKYLSTGQEQRVTGRYTRYTYGCVDDLGIRAAQQRMDVIAGIASDYHSLTTHDGDILERRESGTLFSRECTIWSRSAIRDMATLSLINRRQPDFCRMTSAESDTAENGGVTELFSALPVTKQASPFRITRCGRM